MEKLYKLSLMRKVLGVVGILAISQVYSINAQAQQFTAGRLVVERVGDGSSAQTDAATPTFLDEYSTTGVAGISIALPTVTVPPINRTTESGIASSDGMLTLSMDGHYVVVPGYDAALGTIGVVSTNSPKVVTRVDANGILASTVVTDATAFSGNNFRSVVTTDGSEYWLSGAGNGAVHVLHQGSTVPVAGTEVSNTITDNRNILIYNSQLYQSTAVGPNTGVYSVGSGLPTVPGNTMTIDANLGASGDPYGFVIVKNGTTPVIYVADYNNKVIRKFFQSGATWFTAGSVSTTVGGTPTGFYGLTGNVTGTIVHLYATTCNAIGSNSRVVAFTDPTTGSTAISGSWAGTTIVGPTSNTAIRGISFVPFSVSGITAAASSVCNGGSTIVTITGNPNTSVVYQVNGASHPAVTIPSSGSYSFSTGPLSATTTFTVVSATDGNITQTYGYNVTVSVNAPPVVTSSAGGAICPGGTVGLLASGAISYSWSPASGLSTTTGSGVAASPTSTTSYTVTGTDVNGCVNTARVTVSVNPAPALSTSAPVAICSGGSTMLVVAGAVSYSWSPSAGLSSTTATHVIANPTSTTVYTITGTGSNGCTSSITLPVTINPLPAVSAGPDASICAGGATTLTASGAVVYRWWPLTGISALIGTTVNATPAVTTTYTVTGTDANGCVNTASVTVSVNPIPVVSAITSATDICIGASSDLTASGAATYVWSPGPSLTSTVGSMVTATPTVTTTYTVTGTDFNGCVSRGSVTVNVHATPYVFASPGTGICIGASTRLSASGPSTSYSWSPSTGLAVATGSSVVANPASTTTYTITGTDIHGCVNSATVTVTVYPLPVISAGSGAAICAGSSTVLTATGGATYTWTPGFGLSVTTGSTVTAHPSTTTTYTVTGINTCINSTTVTVTVNPLPSIAGTGATICSGQSAGLTASGGLTYLWSPAVALSATTGSAVTANPTANTIYTITGTDANGCVNRATATVLVNLLPVIHTSSSATICYGQSAVLSATGAASYTWGPGIGLSAGVGASVTASPTTTTTYTVTGTSPYGCVSSATVSVNVNPLPGIFTVTGGGTFCAGGIGVPVGLSGSEGGINYVLYDNSLFSGITRTGTGTALDFGHPSAAGFYTVVATNTATTCSDTMSGGVGITINHGPVAVTVTGGGSYCPDGEGVHVGLAASAVGVLYQLYKDSVAIDSPVAGVGGALDFGLQTAVGTYTATAINPGTSCTSNMTGSATIGILPIPAPFTVTGGGSYCAGGTGVHIGLIGSQIGDRYQVYLGTAPMGTSLIGMNAPLDFGLYTTPGTYTVKGTSSTTGCSDTMSGSATVVINPTPSITGISMMLRHDTTVLAATPAGGTWSSQFPSIISVGSASGVVTGLDLGAGNITYTLPTGCRSTHYITIAFNVGVPGVSMPLEVSLAPNPNNGDFTLKGTFADASQRDATIEIVNMVGQVVYNRKVTVQNGELNESIALPNAAAGTYILTLHTAGGNNVMRFVKE